MAVRRTFHLDKHSSTDINVGDKYVYYKQIMINIFKNVTDYDNFISGEWKIEQFPFHYNRLLLLI